MAKELKKVYTAPDADAAYEALAEFAGTGLGRRYPQAVKVFEDAWDRFVSYLACTPPVRKLLYTTNGIESLNYQLRKVTKARGHFPGDDAAVKLLWLAIINIEDKRARERAAKRDKGAKHAFTRTARRGTTRGRMARSTQRTRHRLSRTDQVKQTSQLQQMIFPHFL